DPRPRSGVVQNVLGHIVVGDVTLAEEAAEEELYAQRLALDITYKFLDPNAKMWVRDPELLYTKDDLTAILSMLKRTREKAERDKIASVQRHTPNHLHNLLVQQVRVL
ncbi:hypothetical protein LTR16_001555, partial [Cryomyces antarcticus]